VRDPRRARRSAAEPARPGSPSSGWPRCPDYRLRLGSLTSRYFVQSILGCFEPRLGEHRQIPAMRRSPKCRNSRFAQLRCGRIDRQHAAPSFPSPERRFGARAGDDPKNLRLTLVSRNSLPWRWPVSPLFVSRLATAVCAESVAMAEAFNLGAVCQSIRAAARTLHRVHPCVYVTIS